MISIIIPCYNVENYIGACLDSVEKQTYDKFEIILIDDGSTDNTKDVIEKFQKISKHPVKIIVQENKGVSAARNCGMKHCEGEYVCFIDADDMIGSDYLLYQYNNIYKNEADISICGVMNIKDSEVNPKVKRFADSTQVVKKEQLLKKLLFHEVNVGIWALLVKKEILTDLLFSENKKYSEDLEMVWKISAKSECAVISKAPLYYYRIRHGSAMSVVNANRYDGYIIMKELGRFLACHAQKFKPLYERYGVARWVWATLWQEAAVSESYNVFREKVSVYNPDNEIKKLLTYPQFHVKVTSFVYALSPKIYYRVVRRYVKKTRVFSR